MKTSEQIDQIAVALVAAQSEMGAAVKDSVNPHLKSKYADLASVVDACRGPLTKNGICYVQTTEPTEANEVRVTTTLLHKSGQWIASVTAVLVNKNDAQGYGSALTYAKRYGLQAITGLPSDDDDGQAASRTGGAITTAQLDTLNDLADRAGADKAAFCKYLGVESFTAIACKDFKKAESALVAKLKQKGRADA